MASEPENIVTNPLFRQFYGLAEKYEGFSPEDMNPSLHELSNVKDRYQSRELIAEGGMKRIFKVYDLRTKRHLAMAMLREGTPEDVYDPFIHEAWLTARLDHPNIITIHDVGLMDGKEPYFTMDLKQGFTLRELIEKLHSGDRKTLALYPREVLLQIFIKICDALSYAHSVNVVHLDLKPANVQIGDYGRVLVCDWGLGRVLGGGDRRELDHILFNPDFLGFANLYGQFKGTPGYMAPEQLAKEATIDARADVYGLGCILYSLLTFLRPLSGDDEQMVKSIKKGAIVPPIQRVPNLEIPKALDAVVMKALMPDPAKRYSSVDLLRSEVQRYLTGFATEAENAGMLKQLNLFYRRNRRFCLTVFLSVALGISGAVFSYYKLHEKERVASEARYEAERTLALYEAGKTELEKVSFNNIDSIKSLAYRSSLMGDATRAEMILKTALEEYPDNEILARELGTYYFCAQRFNEAVPWLDKGIHHDDLLCVMAKKYASIKPDTVPLTVDQMINVITVLHHMEPQMLVMILLDQPQRTDMEKRAKIVEAYLRVINPEWTDGWFEYDFKNSCLRVGGKGLKRLSTQRSVLEGLRLKRLDIRNAEIKEFWLETKLAVEYLDVRNTLIKNFTPVTRLVHLRELVVTEDQKVLLELYNLLDSAPVVVRPLP